MCNVILALALVMLAPGGTTQVTATRLDGTSIAGELQSWEEDQVIVNTPEGPKSLDADLLLSLEWSPGPEDETKEISAAGQLELADGSLIPIDDFHATNTRVTATIATSGPSNDKQLPLERKQLAAVLLRPLEGGIDEQWREIRDMDPTSDVLVLLKRDGASLDYVEGVLGNVSSGKIEFRLDDEMLRIDRAKVAGFTYYSSKEDDTKPRCIVSSRSGLRAVVSKAKLDGDFVQLTTVSGAVVQWPLTDIRSADFSSGKLLHLSDMDPTFARWTPLVGLPTGTELAAEYGQPRRNRSAYGGPLTLLVDAQATSSRDSIRTFHKGLALRSRTELVYRLPAGYRRFTTTAGIDPSTAAVGNVRLEIFGDDRLLVEDDIAGHESPRSIELDIAGVRQLKIVVDYGRNLDTGDWLNLCDARIVK